MIVIWIQPLDVDNELFMTAFEDLYESHNSLDPIQLGEHEFIDVNGFRPP